MSENQNEVEQSTRDNLPWTGKRTWEQKNEQTDTNDATGEPEVKDPSADKQLPQVSEMESAQEVAPEQPKFTQEAHTEETTVTTEQGQDAGSEDSEES